MVQSLGESDKFALSLFGLPSFDSLDELAVHLRYSKSLLHTIWQNPVSFYRQFEIKKPSGGLRRISQPNSTLKSAQRWILRRILSHLNVSKVCKGFRTGESILNNARTHVRANHLLQLDIQDFFPSITPGRVYSLFRAVGYGSFASAVLTSMTTLHSGLPQGAPTSPLIANLVCLRLDARLDGLAASNNVVFTRYADDLTFSSHSPKNLQRIYPFTKKIITEEGFAPNVSKTRFTGLGRRRTITGLVLSGGEVGIGRQKYRGIRLEIFALTKLEDDEAATRIPRIQGWLSHLLDVDPKRYEMLSQLIESLRVKTECQALSSIELVKRQA